MRNLELAVDAYVMAMLKPLDVGCHISVSRQPTFIDASLIDLETILWSIRLSH